MRLDRATRLRNVKRAFAVADGAAAQIHGKIILLVDDVVTTGATADACAQVLKKAGAKEVRVLALARTVRE
jgi:predicted amidophosphoribosyltransferase